MARMRTLPWWCACVASVLVICGPVTAQQEKSEGPPGLAVGEKAPDFKLQDQQGKERSLKEFLGENEKERAEDVIALVFYRSADW